jgi:Holliday junction resolvase
MSNPQKQKGDKAEREAAELLTEVTGFECQRNLSAGIPGDVGDIFGVPNCVIQVCDYKDKSRACLVKPREVETQRENAGVDFATTMVRFRV